MNTTVKIVITGGPGGGKTTAIDLFRREFLDKVSVVPESATTIFSSGIRRSKEIEEVKATQLTIFNLQKNMESLVKIQNPTHSLICDRGTLDGLAYWPNSEKSFFDTINSSFEEELNSYSAVIFFETAAREGADITSNNPYRTEDNLKAIELDTKLKNIWDKHPNFYLIKSNEAFIDKVSCGVKTIQSVLRSLNTSP
jgi:thymidylate kinase